MGRLEAFALGNKPWPSVLDAAGNAFGYSAILIVVAFVRELLGKGELYGFPILKQFGYTGNGLLVISAGASIVMGLVIWAQRARNGYVED
jgi:Na+-transporting NADH:ubiquinone oxidoreductase subunit D